MPTFRSWIVTAIQRDRLPGLRARSGTAGDRRAGHAGERQRLDRLGIDAVDLDGPVARQVDAVAAGETHDAPAHDGEQALHLAVGRRGQREEAQLAHPVVREDTLRDESIEVPVQVRRRPEALDRRHGAADAIAHAAPQRTAALEAEQRAHEHRQCGRPVPPSRLREQGLR